VLILWKREALAQICGGVHRSRTAYK
jgi:hypothetical protein